MMSIQSLLALSMLMALTGVGALAVAVGALTLHTQNPAMWAAGAVAWLTGACAIAGAIATELPGDNTESKQSPRSRALE